MRSFCTIIQEDNEVKVIAIVSEIIRSVCQSRHPSISSSLLPVSLSVGTEIKHQRFFRKKKLFKNAEKACEIAQKSGGNGYCIHK